MIRMNLTDGTTVEYPRANNTRPYTPGAVAVIFRQPGSVLDEVIAVLPEKEIASYRYLTDEAEVPDAR